MKRCYLLPVVFCFLSFTMLLAQPKAGYYNQAEGKSEAGLKTALYNIIKGHTDVGYDGLWKVYRQSDITSDGKSWDMYSTCTWTYGNKQCGSYKTVCDCYNREHSIPQSWFSERSPMRSDAFHVYPTDGKVNGQRSNYPFGECTGGEVCDNSSKALGRLGKSTFAGYSQTVFEPADEYKGDFARTYFYFATRYENIMNSIGGDSFNNTTYPSFSTWSLNLFLKWHRQDPVSQKEKDRNDAVEKFQKNRNPFIDYPELAEYIWGGKKGEPWNKTSGISETEVDFTLVQNPAQGTIELRSNELRVEYFLFTLDGRMLINGSLSGSASIDVSALQDGIYLLQLQSGAKKAVEKVIVR